MNCPSALVLSISTFPQNESLFSPSPPRNLPHPMCNLSRGWLLNYTCALTYSLQALADEKERERKGVDMPLSLDALDWKKLLLLL